MKNHKQHIEIIQKNDIDVTKKSIYALKRAYKQHIEIIKKNNDMDVTKKSIYALKHAYKHDTIDVLNWFVDPSIMEPYTWLDMNDNEIDIYVNQTRTEWDYHHINRIALCRELTPYDYDKYGVHANMTIYGNKIDIEFLVDDINCYIPNHNHELFIQYRNDKINSFLFDYMPINYDARLCINFDISEYNND